ncbi:MAG: acyl-CoA mutase large subunit family protein, partial [Actinobacteria bacterium]|nr:acyl-CoA mutase large subunit family protein [Actinomycetota bacterium]
MAETRRTTSGIEVETVYTGRADTDAISAPGEYPYTRGIHAGMYHDRLWTMRQYAGYGTADETNRRFHDLL